jgi:hypothetical protein
MHTNEFQNPQNQKTPESLKNGQEDRSELKQSGDKLPRFGERRILKDPVIIRTVFGRTIISHPTILR